MNPINDGSVIWMLFQKKIRLKEMARMIYENYYLAEAQTILKVWKLLSDNVRILEGLSDSQRFCKKSV